MFVLISTLLFVGAWLVYEFYAIITGRSTITAIVRSAAVAYPPLGFLVGLLSGGLLAHFFWQ